VARNSDVGSKSGAARLELMQFSELRYAIIDTGTRTPGIKKTHKFDEIQVPRMRITSPKRER
jgi:hypothetical protein